MAKIKKLPGIHIIAGFKHVLDFYLHDGVACVRLWPRNFGRSQTPDSVAQQPMFTYCQRLRWEVSPFVRQAYYDLAPDTGLHVWDWFMRGYYGKIYRYPTE